MNHDLNKLYSSRITELSNTIGSLRTKSRGFIVSEIVSFGVAIGFVVLFTILENASWTLGAALCALFSYFYIRNLDTKNDKKIAEAEALKMVYEKEVAYGEGDYSCFPSGDQYVQPTHAFTYDLDVFGNGSLFQRMNRTISLGGSDCLAESLSGAWEEMPVTELKNISMHALKALKSYRKTNLFWHNLKHKGLKDKSTQLLFVKLLVAFIR